MDPYVANGGVIIPESMDVRLTDLGKPRKMGRKFIQMLEVGAGDSLDTITAKFISTLSPAIQQYPGAFGFFRALIAGMLSGSTRNKDLDNIFMGMFASASSDFVAHIKYDLMKFVQKVRGQAQPAPAQTRPVPVIRQPIRAPTIRQPVRRPSFRRRWWHR